MQGRALPLAMARAKSHIRVERTVAIKLTLDPSKGVSILELAERIARSMNRGRQPGMGDRFCRIVFCWGCNMREALLICV